MESVILLLMVAGVFASGYFVTDRLFLFAEKCRRTDSMREDGGRRRGAAAESSSGGKGAPRSRKPERTDVPDIRGGYGHTKHGGKI